MPREAPKVIDTELNKEFEKLFQDEAKKIEPEERARKSIWALDALKRDNLINSGTNLQEVLRILEERKKELRQTIAYAKDELQGEATDVTSIEMHKIAQEEAESAQRLLGYMEAASSRLTHMKDAGYDKETPLGDIERRLRRELQLREANIDHEEQKQRQKK